MKVFGCTAFVHVDAAARSKLDAKAVRCTFVGYGGDDFGYKFWDNKNLKFIRSRDAVFKETEMFKEKDTAEDAEPVEQESFTEVDGSSEMDDHHCCYFKRFGETFIILLLYVDDMLIAGADMGEILRLKKRLSQEFEMKDRSSSKFFKRAE